MSHHFANGENNRNYLSSVSWEVSAQQSETSEVKKDAQDTPGSILEHLNDLCGNMIAYFSSPG